MKILLDTHMILWIFAEDPRLTKNAQFMICDRNNTIFCSVVSTWEVLLKRRQSPEHFSLEVDDFLLYCRKTGFLPLVLSDKHVSAAAAISKPDNTPRHNDPFDKLLIAQAKTENLIFLTHDKNLIFYNEPCVYLE